MNRLFPLLMLLLLGPMGAGCALAPEDMTFEPLGLIQGTVAATAEDHAVGESLWATVSWYAYDLKGVSDVYWLTGQDRSSVRLDGRFRLPMTTAPPAAALLPASAFVDTLDLPEDAHLALGFLTVYAHPDASKTLSWASVDEPGSVRVIAGREDILVVYWASASPFPSDEVDLSEGTIEPGFNLLALRSRGAEGLTFESVPLSTEIQIGAELGWSPERFICRELTSETKNVFPEDGAYPDQHPEAEDVVCSECGKYYWTQDCQTIFGELCSACAQTFIWRDTGDDAAEWPCELDEVPCETADETDCFLDSLYVCDGSTYSLVADCTEDADCCETCEADR